MEKYHLIDNIVEKRYEFHVEEYIPMIEYMKSNNREIFLTHTEVPVEIEGRGIGTQLVRETLGDIERQGLTLVPLCPFVADYIRRNPEWRHLVMEGIYI